MVEKKKLGFIKTVFHEGNVITLLGHMGSGKTDKAVFFMEKAVQHGYHIFTNINFFSFDDIGKACNLGKLRTGITYLKTPNEIHIVHKLSELLLGLFEHEKSIVVIDESALFVSSTASTSKRVRTLKQLTYIIRHLNASILFICQSKKSIVPELRSDLVTYQIRIRKVSENNRRMIISKPLAYLDESGEEVYDFQVIDTVDEIPCSQLPYDSKFLPVFKIDIDLNDLLDEMADLDSVAVMDQGADVIKKIMEKTKNKQQSKKDMVMEKIKLHPEKTSSDIAALCDCSDRYVQGIRKRTKNNAISS
jgi:hypothetical protein